jgi:hypothetical protein
MSYREGFIKIPRYKNISVNERRHLGVTIRIGDHDIFFFFKRVKNYVTFYITTFSNIVIEVRTLFARNGSIDRKQNDYNSLSQSLILPIFA